MAANKWLLLIHRWTVLYFVRFLLNLFKGPGRSVQAVTHDDDILKTPATVLAARIRSQQITSVQTLTAFIGRIKEVNPLLNCVVDDRFADALQEAATADRLIASGKHSAADLERDQPFLGVPISNKDCIAVKGLLHTSGLIARRHIRATDDSDAVALMRSAGAIPFALTNVSECCMWWESHNHVHGLCRNAYDSNRIPGGSSGGEGCLLSACGSPMGMGSDIGGSIRMPAFFNGIFGHKPSKFIVSNVGQWPAPTETQMSFNSIGPLSRYAVDLAPMLRIMAGPTNRARLRLDEPVDIKKIRIFYQTSDGGGDFISPVDDDINDALQRVVQHFEQISEQRPQRKQIKLLRQSAPIWLGNMVSPDHMEKFVSQLVNLNGKITPYVELAKWFVRQSNHTLIAIISAITEENSDKYGSSNHTFMVKQKEELQKEFDQFLGNDGVLLYPTHPTVAPYHHEPIVRSLNFSYTAIVNTLGLPSTAVPLGIGSEGLPVGIQVIGNLNSDRLCLAVACELEAKFTQNPNTVFTICIT